MPLSGVNISHNSPIFIGEKFPVLRDLGKSMTNFKSVRIVAIWDGDSFPTGKGKPFPLGWGRVYYWVKGMFPNGKRKYFLWGNENVSH
jgi:hypothetical protein